MKGYRGYNTSREINGNIIPQRVQNIVIKDFASRNSLHYKLSATEYCMKNCYMILKNIFLQVHELDGIILYSIWQLKGDADFFNEFKKFSLENSLTICFALENFKVSTTEHWQQLSDLLLTQTLVERVNFEFNF